MQLEYANHVCTVYSKFLDTIILAVIVIIAYHVTSDQSDLLKTVH